jgi:tetratricopeptide (TPR) repeat protein
MEVGLPRISISFACAAAIALAGCIDPADDHFREAKLAYSKQQWQLAVGHLSEVIAADHSAAEALSLRGRANYELRNFSEAVSDFERAKALAPAETGDSEWQLRAYLQLGDIEQAMYLIATATKAESGSPSLYLLSGQVLLAANEPEKALIELDKALQLDPAMFDAFLYSGVACVQLKRPMDAEAHLSRAIEIRPEDGYAYWTRAQAREMRGDQALAESDRAMARELSPGIDFAPANSINIAELVGGSVRDGQSLKRLTPAEP